MVLISEIKKQPSTTWLAQYKKYSYSILSNKASLVASKTRYTEKIPIILQ